MIKSQSWIIISLLLICLLSATLLSFVYVKTKVKIEAQKLIELNQRLSELLPQAKTFQEIIKDTLWLCFDSNNKEIGLIFRVAPQGYGGPIPILVALNLDSTINRIYIGSAAEGLKETPGLGYKIRELNFLEQFIMKNYHSLKLAKDGGKIQAVTGATISSRAVVNGVKAGIERFLKYLPTPSTKIDSTEEIQVETKINIEDHAE
jgi:electron transport complex protein RnfG